jgi:hypothetical protein
VILQHLLEIGITSVLGAQAVDNTSRRLTRNRAGKFIGWFAQTGISAN